ncbi:hypothetical protein D3C73_1125340 [compost metagenome]
MIDSLAQVSGVGAVRHLDCRVAGQCHAGSRAGLVVGQFRCGIEAGGGPELFVKAPVLILQAGELHPLEQGQAPGSDRKDNQQPNDRVLDGFKRRSDEVHG